MLLKWMSQPNRIDNRLKTIYQTNSLNGWRRQKVPAQREESLTKALDHPENWDQVIVQRMKIGLSLFHFDYVKVDGGRLKSIQIESIWIILFDDYFKEIQCATFFFSLEYLKFFKHFISKQAKQIKKTLWKTLALSDLSNNDLVSFVFIA